WPKVELTIKVTCNLFAKTVIPKRRVLNPRAVITMNSVDKKFQQASYNKLRQQKHSPLEAVIELGFSDHIADSVAKRMEETYQKEKVELEKELSKAFMNLTKEDIESAQEEDPKKFLLQVMNDEDVDLKERMKIAFQLLPYTHSKKATQQPKG